MSHPDAMEKSVEIPTRWSFVIEFIITKFFLRLNMFRAAHRSSSGALNCICSLWFMCPYGDHPLPRQRPVTIWAHKPEAANRV
jgi:hypothetical protein